MDSSPAEHLQSRSALRSIRLAIACSALLAAFLASMESIAADVPQPRRVVSISLQTAGPTMSAAAKSASAAAKTGEPSPSESQLTSTAVGPVAADARVVGSARRTERPSPRRAIQYSTDHLVIVGLGADGSELTRTAVIDPRLVRAEALFGGDRSATSNLYRKSVEFSLAIDDPAVVAIKVLRPVWNGSEWSLEPLAEALLR